MPNCGGRTIRAHSPYWRNASPARKKTVPARPDESQAMQTSNQIGEQLLLTLVQSLPSCGTEAARSRSSCPPTFRRKIRSNSCGRSLQGPSVSKSKSPVRLQTMQGMAVRQVSGRDRTTPKVAEPAKPFVPYSIEAFLKRRRESAMAKAKAREAEYEKIPRSKGGNKPEDSPIEKSSPEVSNHSSKEVSQRSTAKSSEKSSPNASQGSTPKGSQDVSPRSTPKSSRKSSVEISDRSPKGSQKSSEEISKNSSQNISQRSSPKGSQKSIEEVFKQSSANVSQASSQRNSESNPVKEEPIEVAKEAVETQTPTREQEEQEQEEQPNEKIFPCFRGEYPTRHRQDSYQWFQAAVPNCGNIVTICDEERMLGPAEIVTACEVTEAHFLTMDDNAPDLSVVAPCNKCGQFMYGYPQQQQQEQQQPDGNWFRPQQVPCRQQQVPCMQQQPSFMQHQRPCMQQQKPCMQQRRSNCRQSPPNKGCWKCQDQQPQIQPNGLTEILAEELKQQMQEAQAQIAQVQLQLNSACGATRVRQMHVLPQGANDGPGYAPTTQFRSPITADQDECNEEEVNENLSEDAMPSEQQQEPPMQPLGSQKSRMGFSQPQPSPQSSQQQMQFGLYPLPLSMPNQSPSFQAMPFPCQQQHPASFLPQQLPTCQQQRPPCQQQRPPCQQQRPPCPMPMPPCQQQRPPCQQQQPAFPCQQKQQEPPQNQNQKPNQNPSPSPPNMYAYGPHFCPSWCCQRYAQMRFMMPRCWPR